MTTLDFNCIFGEEEEQEEILPLPTMQEVAIATNHLSPWPTRLPLELALGVESEEQLLEKYQISREQYDSFKNSIAFRRELSEMASQVREFGLTFKEKCKVIAEEWLEELFDYMRAPDIAFAQKLDAWKNVARLAGLEPKEDKNQTFAPQVNIQFNC